VRLAVTTPGDPSPSAEGAAREAAARHALPFAPRAGRSLAAVAAAAGADALLVLGADARLWLAGEGAAARRWSPGMGALRARRLADGERSTADGFLAAAGIRPGDAVLDCTLGLGADALVAAEAAGEAGRIVGVESSPALAAWVAEGLSRLPLPAARRVSVVRADHAAFLAGCPERSFDVVVFDPMFRHARAQGAAFDAVRRLADPRPLEASAVARARQVARRAVVVKDGTPGWDLARLGLVPLPSARGAHRLYASLPAA
jgi:16S rRNA (guanine1516-N2)-methyltransferase